MKRPTFPSFTHTSQPVQNLNELDEAQASMGDRAADKVAQIVGSWGFIIGQSVLLVIWIILNITAWVQHWDPYPFILMNLFLSMQAAFTAPIIMMSQNRQASRDRLEAHNDFLINKQAEEEIRAILQHLESQNESLAEIHQLLAEMKQNDEER
ncbi:MAG: DUF1003 domain-containing protein [Chloroflexota bacterium]